MQVKAGLKRNERFKKIGRDLQRYINMLVRPKIVKRHSRRASQRKEEDEN